jgi:hypothetical protein
MHLAASVQSTSRQQPENRVGISAMATILDDFDYDTTWVI